MWATEDNDYIKVIYDKNHQLLAFKATVTKGSKQRTLYIPSPQTSKILRSLLPYLETIYERNKQTDAAHGFLKSRSPLSNAKQHIKFDFTISLDIKNFFESIYIDRLKGLISNKVLDVCSIDGTLPQGFPTSPIISNIAMINFDNSIEVKLKELVQNKYIHNFCYTRYADDLSISFNIHNDTRQHLSFNNLQDLKRIYFRIGKKIELIAERELDSIGLILNHHKTKHQIETNGNRVITGIAVNRNKVKASRKTRRKLRAALHQGNPDSAIGIFNWIRYISKSS